MKELKELNECILKITSAYGNGFNSQKRDLWNAFERLEKRLIINDDDFEEVEKSLKILGHDVTILKKL